MSEIESVAGVVEEEYLAVEVAILEEEPLKVKYVVAEEVEIAEEELPKVKSVAEVKYAVAEEFEIAKEELTEVKSPAVEEKSVVAVVEEAGQSWRGGERVMEKVYVKRKKRKNNDGIRSNTPKRIMRSTLKDDKEEENVEKIRSPIVKKLEFKMSKKIGLGRMPTNMRELLETGFLEGFRVFYNLDNEIILPSQFELHARNSYRHAIKNICLENGKSLLEGPPMCTNFNGSIEPSSTENLLICDTCLNKRPVQLKPNVATPEDVSTSSPVPNTLSNNSLSILSDNKSRRGRKRKSAEPVLKSSKSATKYKLSQNKIKLKVLKRSIFFCSYNKLIMSKWSDTKYSVFLLIF